MFNSAVIGARKRNEEIVGNVQQKRDHQLSAENPFFVGHAHVFEPFRLVTYSCSYEKLNAIHTV
ncbi:hypothetical protein GK047_24690 [Paenibacillus sp. SYP-B3998]|uniref:Uncharacterized protein n=1 Tax=Paenibacillus sp. SYP-B3998 TaxID=2678564 RepID=A0A6G4A3U8_9BACL|nr:hypothetical protein [Paenibacillus sp. SYP-B3998]NEW09176.1 hypothetical protein [Paenibacillus sp. SYP-B3998]